MIPHRALLVAPLLVSTCPAPPGATVIHFQVEPLAGTCVELDAAGGPTRDGEGVGDDGEQYASLQDALNRAPEGSQLLLGAGVYCVNLLAARGAVSLAPEAGAEAVLDGTACLIDREDVGCSTLTAIAEEGGGLPEVRLGGLTVVGGAGVMVSTPSSSPTPHGGGIFASAVSLSLEGTRVLPGLAADAGGGVYAQGCAVTVLGARFEGLRASHGAALRTVDGSLTLRDTSFVGNSATADGGAIFVDGTGVDGEGITFTGNRGRYGGGLNGRLAALTLSQLTATGNQAVSGGVLDLFESEVELTGAILEDNLATLFGGALTLSGGQLTARDLRATRNRAKRGGALFLENTPLTLTASVLRENVAEEYGGGLLHDGGAATVTATAFLRNVGKWGGHIATTDGYTPVLAQVTLDHVTAIGGRADSGGGVWGRGSALTITDSIFAFNAAITGPNLAGEPSSAPRILRTMLWDRATEGPGLDTAAPGEGCIVAPPRFYDDPYQGDVAGDDVHLRPGSVGVDAAAPGQLCLGGGQSVPCLDPDGSPADLGAFGGPDAPESDEDGDGLPDGWEAAHGLDPADPDDALGDDDGDGITALAELASGGDPQRPDTDGDGHGDGAEALAGTDLQHPVDPGPHPDAPRTLYVPDDAADLTAALALSSDRVTVVLRPGVHTAAVVLDDRDVRLTSEAGPEATELRGDGQGPVLTLLNPPLTASIEGITVTGGVGEGIRVYGGAGRIAHATLSGNMGRGLTLLSATATVEDVAVRDNAAEDGGGIFLEQGAPILRDVEVSGNVATRGGGLFLHIPGPITFDGVRVAGNLAEDGGGVYLGADPVDVGGILVTDNDATRGGGFYVESYGILNARAVGNRAQQGGGVYLTGYVDSIVAGGRITGNHATSAGGGIHQSGSGSYGVTLSQVWIDGNRSDDLGGGIYLGDLVGSRLDGVALVGNVARAGGGLYAWRADQTDLARVVAVANKATGGVGGGIYLNEVSGYDGRGLIVTRNGGGTGKDGIFAKASYGTVAESVVHGGTTDVTLDPTVVLADPLLRGVPAIGQTAGADLHLLEASPAVGLWTSGGDDADGSPADAGIYGGPEGASWDTDRDGLPAWWWPGAYEAAPSGVDAAAFDGDDLSPDP